MGYVLNVFKRFSDDPKGNWWCASQVFGSIGALLPRLEYPLRQRASNLLDDLAK